MTTPKNTDLFKIRSGSWIFKRWGLVHNDGVWYGESKGVGECEIEKRVPTLPREARNALKQQYQGIN